MRIINLGDGLGNNTELAYPTGGSASRLVNVGILTIWLVCESNSPGQSIIVKHFCLSTAWEITAIEYMLADDLANIACPNGVAACQYPL